MSYVGRFAPSPTGPLHAGSVATAVASFLHARQRGGQWLLRIDDLDPPRCVPGSADAIRSMLETLELNWDGSVYLQSARRGAHEAVAMDLLARGLTFRCDCSRRDLLNGHKTGELGVRYEGRCRTRTVAAHDSAIRLRVSPGKVEFTDALQGRRSVELLEVLGDYVIYRRDGLPAYHLACVLDDADMAITDVVRGSDLLPSTSVHVHLAGALGLARPQYWHIPVVCDAHGEKLAKSHAAASVAQQPARTVAFRALEHIGAAPPAELVAERPATQWQWGIENWRIECLQGISKRQLASDS